MDGHKIILTNGFIKKTQKSPVNEIEKAKSQIKKVLKELNIKPEQINNKGYTKMLWEKTGK